MKQCYVYLMVVFISFVIFSCIPTVKCLRARISMSLLKSGFHKNLEYKLTFPEPPLYACDVMIQHTFPRDVYISNDELNDLMRQKKINYFINETINVEQLPRDSKQFVLFLYGGGEGIIILSTINLPLHFRYQLPGYTSHVRVNVTKPKLYLSCKNDKDDYEVYKNKRIQAKCKDSDDKCTWHEIKYEAKPQLLTAFIPIGNVNHLSIVKWVTHAVAWGGAVVLIFMSRVINDNINTLKPISNKMK